MSFSFVVIRFNFQIMQFMFQMQYQPFGGGSFKLSGAKVFSKIQMFDFSSGEQKLP